MIRLPDIKGLKFPDEFVVRYFFKERLHERPGRVLELGCGNANNLMLFYQYGWDVVGLDINRKALEYAEHNFTHTGGVDSDFKFTPWDLAEGLPSLEGPFDVVLMPSVMYYISRSAMIDCLRGLRKLVSPGGSFFMRMRLIGDYRCGRGRLVEPNGYVLDITETGEEGVLNVFYHEYELVDMLRDHLEVDMETLKLLNLSFDNIQSDVLVSTNREVVTWGKLLP